MAPEEPLSRRLPGPPKRYNFEGDTLINPSWGGGYTLAEKKVSTFPQCCLWSWCWDDVGSGDLTRIEMRGKERPGA